MSERTYFNFRYALPGYTFLILILVVNLEYFLLRINQLSNIFPETITLFGFFFTFISLLGGSAIGFLISQFWYVVNNHYNKKYRYAKRRSYKKLHNIIKYTDDITHSISIMTYILYSKVEEKEVIKYVNRLGDMYNALASTFVSICLGLILSYYLHFGFFKQNWRCYDGIIIFISIVFMVMIFTNAMQVIREWDSMVETILKINEQDIRTDFGTKK